MTKKSTESTLAIADKQSDASIDVSKVSKVKASKKTKSTTNTLLYFFPFTFTFSKPMKGRPVEYKLKRKRGEYKSVTIADRVKQLVQPENSYWHKHIAKLKKDGIRYLRKNRIRFAMVKVRDITIDDDIQRDLDTGWCTKIGNPEHFEVEYMSPIQAVKDVGVWKFHSINAQHTVVLETAYAYNQIWDDYEGDPLDLEVPVIYIETNDRSKARKGFRILNGKGQKKIEPYDNHKMMVFSYRIDGDTSVENKDAHVIQKINEDNGFEPISSQDEDNRGASWAITAVTWMMKYYKKPKAWEFILKTHKRYWPNVQLSTMEIDLYGFMYEYFSAQGVDVYSDEFNEKFLDSAHAVIQHYWTYPSQYGIESGHTQIRWYAKTWSKSEKDVGDKIEREGSFIMLLKLYRAFGGQYKLPDIVDLFNNDKAGDLLNSCPDYLKKDLAKYATT